jgi:metallophosphoesterase superfamily enzyme
MVLDDTLLIHGHTIPSSSRASIKRLIMGHIHPVFFKHGSIINGQRVWIYLKVRKETIFPYTEGTLEIMIIPTFNKYLYTTKELRYRKTISPIINKVLKNNGILLSMIFALDGSIIGDIDLLQTII